MLLFIIRMIFVCVGTGAIATYCFSPSSPAPLEMREHPVVSFVSLMLVMLLFVLFDVLVPKKRVDVASAIYFGLLIGILLSFLLNQALMPLFATKNIFGDEGQAIRGLVIMLSTIVLPYLCVTYLLQTKDDFRFVIPYVEFARELKGGRPLVLDSSALIDGRIADVVDTHIIDSQMLVPQFILQEVQDIADSNDKIRRSRGRRGLDVLKRLQDDPNIDVKVQESDVSKANGVPVDQQIVDIAKQYNGRIVTNDFNLNKVATVQGIDVVNLNDVANALKPRFIPGEHISIKIIKEGEGAGQGVGYLDDGTMVVCEQGSQQIGSTVDVTVTSVLQNSAGRMIFGRLTSESA